MIYRKTKIIKILTASILSGVLFGSIINFPGYLTYAYANSKTNPGTGSQSDYNYNYSVLDYRKDNNNNPERGKNNRADNSGSKKTTIEVIIDSGGKISSNGNMFANTLWYPGKKENGTIRIINKYQRVKITDLVVETTLLKWNNDYGQDMVENSLLQNMKLTITQKNSSPPNHPLVNDACLSGFWRGEGDNRNQGYHLDNEGQCYLGKGDYLDWEYSLVMAEESGNELQDLMANIRIMINFEQKKARSLPGE